MDRAFDLTANASAVLQLTQMIGLFTYSLTERSGVCRRLMVEVICVEGLISQLKWLNNTLEGESQWQSKWTLLGDLLEDLRTSLSELDEKLQPLRVSQPQRLLAWPLHERDINNVLDKIERCKMTILVHLQVDHTHLCNVLNQRALNIRDSVSVLVQDSKETAAHRQEQVRRQKKKEREATLAWLTNVSFASEHDELQQKWVVDTSTWFFADSKFQLWETSTSSNTLVVLGNAGCGKTMLASRLVERIKGRSIHVNQSVLAYLYCSQSQPAKTDPTILASSILQQLCQSAPVLNESVVQLREKYRGYPNSSPNLIEIESVLASVVQGLTQVCHIVLDGLDECPDGDSLEICRVISSLGRIPGTRVKAALFSRHTCAALTKYMENVPRISITSDANHKDIELFAHTRLRSLAQVNPVLQSETLRNDIVKSLLAKANGMFLWVQFRIKDLLEQPTERLLRKALTRETPEINHVFERSLRRIESLPDATRQIAVDTLQWAMHAKRPLHISEMLEAIAIEEGMKSINAQDLVPKSRLMNFCADLVVLNHNDHVQISHTSLRSVLQGDSRNPATSELAKQFPSSPDHYLAKRCLSYLLLDNFEVSRFSSSGLENEIRTQYPFLRYAACNWSFHANRLKDSMSDLKNEMLALLSSQTRMELIEGINALENNKSINGSIKLVKNRNALHFMAKYGLADLLRELEPKQFQEMSIESDSENLLPLDLALRYKHHSICVKLLELRPWLTKQNTERLHLAVRNGWPDAVQMMLSLRVPLDELDSRGFAPLHVACVHGHGVEIVDILLKLEADINVRTCHEANTSLMLAAELGKTDIVKHLLAKNANATLQNDYKQTALHLASQNGHIEVVKLLLQSNDPQLLVDRGDKYGETPIFDAVQKGRGDVVQQLIKNGATLQHMNIARVTPLHVAAAYHQIEVFLSLDLSSNEYLCRDANGWRAAQIITFMYTGFTEGDFADFLPNDVAEVCEETLRGVLNISTQLNSENACKSILKVAKFEPHTYSELSMLHTAAAAGSISTVRALLEDPSTDIWQRDPWGRTAYELAIGDHRQPIRDLIESTSELRSIEVPTALTHPASINLSNQSYLQRAGCNFCLFVMCELCEEHINNQHWLHCKLCSKLGEGWDICEKCFQRPENSNGTIQFCPANHGGKDLELLYIANHMISGPTVDMPQL